MMGIDVILSTGFVAITYAYYVFDATSICHSLENIVSECVYDDNGKITVGIAHTNIQQPLSASKLTIVGRKLFSHEKRIATAHLHLPHLLCATPRIQASFTQL